ncbi:hypothetical protein M427DRAFT_70856 [Gonapodya prolifera JEL478]|uniref:Zn(2)-C6 fungal-type domain-containing protein n=1 Tax=Gonapodya prolifera (strain JEL478) TaxID=1344416 RepID=A0A139AC06_GONPJ|nr:hypothetical protein M427DRAFT_70856 [Gonapodya prolifera JEL478]|eukprot:KXS14189.1 hypothetical protein M427DRAFT_70856 [Gonapodya prolifera JEL478]
MSDRLDNKVKLEDAHPTTLAEPAEALETTDGGGVARVRRKRVLKGPITPRACDACHRMKIKCDGVKPRCGACSRRKRICDWDWKPEKGRTDSRAKDPTQANGAPANRDVAESQTSWNSQDIVPPLPLHPSNSSNQRTRHLPSPTSSDDLEQSTEPHFQAANLTVAREPVTDPYSAILAFGYNGAGATWSDSGDSPPKRRHGERSESGNLSLWNGAQGFPSPEFGSDWYNSSDTSAHDLDQLHKANIQSGTLHMNWSSIDTSNISALASIPGKPIFPQIDHSSLYMNGAHQWSPGGSFIPRDTIDIKPTLSISSGSTGIPPSALVSILPQTSISTTVPFTYSNLSTTYNAEAQVSQAPPRRVPLFGGLSPLPDQSAMNECVQLYTHVLQHTFPILHIPNFLLTTTQHRVHPALYLAVATMGSLHHPRRSQIRNAIALQLHATIKACMGTLELGLVQALALFSTFLMTEAGRLAIGLKWHRGTIKAAKALGVNIECSSENWIEQEERRRLWAYLYQVDTLLAGGYKQKPIIKDAEYLVGVPCSESDFWSWSRPTKPVREPQSVFREKQFLEFPEESCIWDDDFHLMQVSLAFVYRRRMENLALGQEGDGFRFRIEALLNKWFEILPPGLKAVATQVETEGITASSFFFRTGYERDQYGRPGVAHQVGHLLMMAVVLFLTLFGPKTPNNYLADVEWSESENFSRCIEKACQGTRVLECIMRSFMGLTPVAGGAISYHVFQIGMVHLVHLKNIVGRLQDTTSETEIEQLQETGRDALRQVEVHGEALKTLSSLASAPGALLHLWEQLVRDQIPPTILWGMAETTASLAEMHTTFPRVGDEVFGGDKEPLETSTYS